MYIYKLLLNGYATPKRKFSYGTAPQMQTLFFVRAKGLAPLAPPGLCHAGVSGASVLHRIAFLVHIRAPPGPFVLCLDIIPLEQQHRADRRP